MKFQATKFNFYFRTRGANRISGIVGDMNFVNLRIRVQLKRQKRFYRCTMSTRFD